MSPVSDFVESAVNLLGEDTRIEGNLHVDRITRLHGTLIGDVLARDGSTLILAETSLIEGNIQGDTILIDGFVRGNIVARTKVTLSGRGRVVGNIKTPCLKLEFGAYFEGRSSMEEEVLRPAFVPPARGAGDAPAPVS